jgi:hypothetical protein
LRKKGSDNLRKIKYYLLWLITQAFLFFRENTGSTVWITKKKILQLVKALDNYDTTSQQHSNVSHSNKDEHY